MSHSILRRTAEATCGAGFVRNRDGGAAVMFALVSPLALLAIMGVSGYEYNLQYRADVKTAMDGAALTATQALAQNNSADVSAIGQAYFKANAPADALTNGAASFSQAPGPNGSLIVTGQYNGKTVEFLGGYISFNSLPVSATSQLSLTPNTSSGGSSSGGGTSSGGTSSGGTSSGGTSSGGTSSGSSAAAIVGAGSYSTNSSVSSSVSISVGGKTYSLACGATPQWYNMLSDAGLQVNASCQQDPNNPGASFINAVNILLRGHSIYVNAATPNYVNGVPDYTSAPIWWGNMTLDGTYYPVSLTLPSKVDANGNTVAGAACGSGSTFTSNGSALHMQNVCQVSYLGDSVLTTVEDSSDIYLNNNYVEVFDGHGYGVLISFAPGARAVIGVLASGVGAQGAPGGFFGQSMSGGTDTNAADFLLDGTSPTGNTYQGASYPASVTDTGANGVGSQYSWTWPASSTAVSGGGTIKQIQ